MEELRFLRFAILTGEIQKSLHKIKWANAVDFGLKGVHVFWLIELLHHPEGLSMSELSKLCMNDRALLSREIPTMEKHGYVFFAEDAPKGRHRYSAKLKLTEKGQTLALEIQQEGLRVQKCVNYNISEQELKVFYETLEKMRVNFEQVIEAEEASASRLAVAEGKEKIKLTEELT